MNEDVVTLYDCITSWGENSADSFRKRFNEVTANPTVSTVKVHIHCYGGEVLEGNAIINTIKQSKKPVHAYVDGVAASMAAIVMIACDKVIVAENSLIMIHAPHACVCGTANDLLAHAKQMKLVEANFKKSLVAKTGKSHDEVSKWLLNDTWFDANEAIEVGLADEQTGKTAFEVPTIARAKNIQMLAQSSQWRVNTHNTNSQIQNTKKMTDEQKQKFITDNALSDVTATSSVEEIMAAMQAKIKAVQEQAVQVSRNNIESMVQEAKNKGLITADVVPAFIAIGEKAGVDALKTSLTQLKPVPSLVDIAKGASSAAGQITNNPNSWTWDDWQKNDVKGLEAMPKNNPEQFIALYEKKYGEKPKM